MRHNIHNKKLSRTSKHRKSLRMNLIRSFLLNGKIMTTITKAKFFIPFAEKILTYAKNDNLTTRRFLLSKFCQNKLIMQKIIDIAKNLNNNGGNISSIKVGNRKGDGAKMVLVNLINKKKL